MGTAAPVNSHCRGKSAWGVVAASMRPLHMGGLGPSMLKARLSYKSEFIPQSSRYRSAASQPVLGWADALPVGNSSPLLHLSLANAIGGWVACMTNPW